MRFIPQCFNLALSAFSDSRDIKICLLFTFFFFDLNLVKLNESNGSKMKYKNLFCFLINCFQFFDYSVSLFFFFSNGVYSYWGKFLTIFLPEILDIFMNLLNQTTSIITTNVIKI